MRGKDLASRGPTLEIDAVTGYHKSVSGTVVGSVVESRSITKKIYGMFVPPQKSIRTEVRSLIPGVAGDGIGKCNL
jgi:hypothetical protein